MTFSIREANETDIISLLELRAILLDGDGHLYSAKDIDKQRQWRKDYTEWLLNFAFSADSVRVLVASDKETIFGCAIGVIDRRAPTPSCRNGISGWVQSVVTAPSYRGKGVANNLLANLISCFEENSCFCVILEATPISVTLYKRLGFVSNGETLMTRVKEARL